MTRTLTAVALVLSAIPAFAADPVKETITPGNTTADAPSEWQGDVPHFILTGVVNGYHFGVQYQNMADAVGITEFEAKREYVADDSGYTYRDIEVTLKAEIGTVEKEIEFEFETHDFNSATYPVSLPLAAHLTEGSNAIVFEIEFEWEVDGISVDEEVSDWEGTLTLMEDKGTPDDKGLLPDGRIGGFLTAAQGDNRLTASFTVPVTRYEIDD